MRTSAALRVTRIIAPWRELILIVFAAAAMSLSLAAPVARSTIVLDRVLAVASDAARFPVDAVAAPVTLPDRWATTRPGLTGSVWYRAGFRLGADAAVDGLLALYVDRACSNLQVHLNGFLIFSGGRTAEPVTRNCSRPQLITLPSALLRANENLLDLQVQGYALERVAAQQTSGGLSQIEVGPLATLRRDHAAHYFWAVTWTQATGLLLIGIGCVLLAVGWLNRREVYFSYLGWLCLAWVAVSMTILARDMPWLNDVTEFMLCSSWAVVLALAVQFFLSFAGLRSRTIENLIALQWVLLPLSLVLVGPERLFDVARVWYVLLGLELLAAMAIYLGVTRRQRPQDFGPMALVSAAGAIALVIELGVQWELIDAPRVSMARIIVPVLFVGVATRLMLMFARALRTTEEDRNRVSGQLHQLSAELEARVQQLTAQRVGQFTELERKRIASDLHDDLGAKLLTIVHTSDTARVPQLAREALDEMRLSVRGLAGKAVPLDDAIADWRAEIMGRLEQARIEAKWRNAAAADSPMLSARSFMQLTRILRESVSNVIKHSGATHCDIRCTVVDGTLRLKVKDDGCGISQDLNRGQGMASMKRRAKRMNGQCLVESRPGHGVVISLTVPL